MNKILSVLFAGLLTTQAYAAAPGLPVVDPTAIAQMVQQLTQLQQMYSQLQAQYNTAVNTLNNFTGTRGLGMFGYNTALRQFLPSNFESQMRNVLNGGVSQLTGAARAIYDNLNLGARCATLNGEDKAFCEKQGASFAQYQAFADEGKKAVDQRLQNIENLMKQIDSATDAKAIADLNARIQAEKVAFEASQLSAQMQLASQKALNEKMLQEQALNKHQKAFQPLAEEEILKGLTK